MSGSPTLPITYAFSLIPIFDSKTIASSSASGPPTMQMPATILRKWWALDSEFIVPSFQGHPSYTALVTIVTYCTSDCTTAS